jgi:hypothetical protein
MIQITVLYVESGVTPKMYTISKFLHALPETNNLSVGSIELAIGQVQGRNTKQYNIKSQLKI